MLRFKFQIPIQRISKYVSLYQSNAHLSSQTQKASLLDLNMDKLNVTHNDSMCNVLVCGDGDLSYSLALARHNSTKDKLNEKDPSHHKSLFNLIATTFQSGELLTGNHPSSHMNINELEKLDCEVRTGVDATKLHETFELKHFHRIVWNFPQHPERRKIQFHRQLLKDFFESAGQCLRDDGEIWVTLKGGQGGSKGELLEYERDKYSNTWQIQEQAGTFDFVLASVTEANIDKLEKAGYRSVGFRGSDRSFFTKGSLTHIFTLPQQVSKVSENGLIQHPLIYRRDIGFWINENFNSEEIFNSFVSKIMKPKNISYNIEMFDEYKCPKTLRISRNYHIDLWSTTHALSKRKVREIIFKIDIELFERGMIDAMKMNKHPPCPTT